jgi:hypothetical protein
MPGAMSHTILSMLCSQVNDLRICETSGGINAKIGEDVLYRPRGGVLHGRLSVVGLMLSYLRLKSQFYVKLPARSSVINTREKAPARVREGTGRLCGAAVETWLPLFYLLMPPAVFTRFKSHKYLPLSKKGQIERYRRV